MKNALELSYAGINKQGKIGGSKAYDGAGKTLPVEYSERDGHYLQAYFQKEGDDQLPGTKKKFQCGISRLTYFKS